MSSPSTTTQAPPPECPSTPSSPPRAEATDQQQQQQQQSKVIALPAQQQAVKSEDYRKLFHLPAEEVRRRIIRGVMRFLGKIFPWWGNFSPVDKPGNVYPGRGSFAPGGKILRFLSRISIAPSRRRSYSRGVCLQGHMYLFEQYICFYSNIFGYEKKKVLPLKDVAFVRKGWTAGLFPNAIEIGVWGKKYFFASFLSRDEAYRLIVNGWSRHSGHARAFASSDSSVGVQSAPDIQQVSTLQSISSCKISSSEIVEPPATEDSEVKQVLPKPPEKALDRCESSLKNDSLQEADPPALSAEFKMVMESEFPVDVEDFFELFFSNNALSFIEAFHKRCGDEDFRCTQWASHPGFGSVRDLSFRHPVNLYFGPKSALCNETQKVRFYRNNHLVIETSQQMSDIPYADYFHVEVRWDITRVPKDVSFHSFVRASMNVVFSKRTFWRGKIEQATLDECKETYSLWVQEAYSVLSSKANANQACSTDAEVVPSSGDENSALAVETSWSKGISGLKLRDLWEFEVADGVARSLRKSWEYVAGCFSGNPMLAVVLVIAVLVIVTQIVTLMAVSRKEPPALGLQEPIGRCIGGSGVGAEAMSWLEQRARFVKEEIALVEARLQGLHQDLSMLKLHMNVFTSGSNDK